MGFEAILSEVNLLQGIGTRLTDLAEVHLPLSDGLRAVAVSVRNAATLLSVLLATKVNGTASTVQ
jgi:hypothetical protein